MAMIPLVAYLDLSYRWTPPICSTCCVFGHVLDYHEPKVQSAPVFVTEEGKKKPNTGGPSVMTSDVDVASVPVGPVVSLGPKEVGVVVTQVSATHVAGPLPLPKGSLTDKGKIPVSNQHASLSGPVLDDYFDGVIVLWEKADSTDPGGPSKVIEDDEVVGSDTDEAPPYGLLG
ncbi:hypothetical protein L1987_54437 [Smallanthus sonchifolius]|uniref:Uncharacterized protein n=1 Tax=Smallanthus sonchifolius TaxID=185202 RepID=A0ACB9E705_9ASTR|nr:hypothetical protein L1987_54437 [Smallanthus sonchifolius]